MTVRVPVGVWQASSPPETAAALRVTVSNLRATRLADWLCKPGRMLAVQLEIERRSRVKMTPWAPVGDSRAVRTHTRVCIVSSLLPSPSSPVACASRCAKACVVAWFVSQEWPVDAGLAWEGEVPLVDNDPQLAHYTLAMRLCRQGPLGLHPREGACW